MKPMELIEQGRFLGEEFVLWLWMRGLDEGGTTGLEGDSSACFLDDTLVLVSERGDVKELSLRKGNPTESREAFEALSRGIDAERGPRPGTISVTFPIHFAVHNAERGERIEGEARHHWTLGYENGRVVIVAEDQTDFTRRRTRD